MKLKKPIKTSSHQFYDTARKYFNELLVNHKNNIKEIWKILNSIIQRNKFDRQYPTSFENNNIAYSDAKILQMDLTHFLQILDLILQKI